MRTIVLGLALFAAPVVAETTCTFTTECLEGEACNDTTLSATVSQGEGETLRWETDAETLDGFLIAAGSSLHYVFEGTSAAHLMTHYEDGAVRYSVHMDGPFTITYHGTCEGKP